MYYQMRRRAGLRPGALGTAARLLLRACTIWPVSEKRRSGLVRSSSARLLALKKEYTNCEGRCGTRLGQPAHCLPQPGSAWRPQPGSCPIGTCTMTNHWRGSAQRLASLDSQIGRPVRNKRFAYGLNQSGCRYMCAMGANTDDFQAGGQLRRQPSTFWVAHQPCQSGPEISSLLPV